MERRRYKRFLIRSHSVILSNSKSYAGFIKNVSEDGVGYIMSTVKDALDDLIPGEHIKIIILTPSGETLNLDCEIRWTSAPCEDKKLCLGVKIIEPPEKYREFLKTFG